MLEDYCGTEYALWYPSLNPLLGRLGSDHELNLGKVKVP